MKNRADEHPLHTLHTIVSSTWMNKKKQVLKKNRYIFTWIQVDNICFWYENNLVESLQRGAAYKGVAYVLIVRSFNLLSIT